MARLASEVLASASTNVINASTYNSATWNLGSLIKQRSDVPYSSPFIGPIINSVARPVEAQGGSYAGVMPWTVNWSSNIDWIFLHDGTAAANQRRLKFFTFNKTNSQYTWVGDVCIFYPSLGAGGNYTVQGWAMDYQKYNNGMVTVTGNTVNGYQNAGDSSLQWNIDGMCVSTRIGFGSKDPTQIAPTNWYTIASILTDTSILLTTPISGNINSSTPYVIEDLRAYHYTSSSNASMGGLFVTKGLSYNSFGTTAPWPMCPSAGYASGDGSMGTYWLTSVPFPVGAVQTYVSADISAAGMTILPMQNWQNHFVYTLNYAGSNNNVRIARYNVRRNLSPAGTLIALGTGRSFQSIDICTNYQSIGTVPAQKTNNLVFAVHNDSRNQIKDPSGALYFVTPTKFFGAPINAVNGNSGIVAGATTFVNAVPGMSETPPGTASYIAAGGALQCIDYAETLDRFVITSTGAAGIRSYVTHYGTDGEQFDHVFLIDDKTIDQAAAFTNNVNITVPGGYSIAPHPSVLAEYQTVVASGGICYIACTPAAFGGSATTNMIHSIPIGAEWTYSSSTNTLGQAITPVISTPNANKYVRAYISRQHYLGNDVIGQKTDAIRLSYRTSLTGTDLAADWYTTPWTILNEPYDMSNVSGSNYIQFKVEFKTITDLCVPARVYVVGVVYDDNTSDSHFQPSVGTSSTTSKQFGWRFSTAFGSSPLPAFKIILNDAVTGSNYITDYTDVSSFGSFTKSYDGVNFGLYDTSDLNWSGLNNTTYIKYTPAAGQLGDNIKVKASFLRK